VEYKATGVQGNVEEKPTAGSNAASTEKTDAARLTQDTHHEDTKAQSHTKVKTKY